MERRRTCRIESESTYLLIACYPGAPSTNELSLAYHHLSTPIHTSTLHHYIIPLQHLFSLCSRVVDPRFLLRHVDSRNFRRPPIFFFFLDESRFISSYLPFSLAPEKSGAIYLRQLICRRPTN